MMIEVKIKQFLEPVLNSQILGLIIERLGTPTTNDNHMATIINHQMRCVTSSWIWSALWFPDGRSRTIERNQSTDPKVTQSERDHGAHIISNSPSFLIKSFLSRINSRHVTKAGNKLPSSSTNGWSLGLSMSSMSMTTMTTSYIMREGFLVCLVGREDAARSLLFLECFSLRCGGVSSLLEAITVEKIKEKLRNKVEES